MDDIAKTYPELPPEILDFIEALQQQNSVLKADLARKDESGQQAEKLIALMLRTKDSGKRWSPFSTFIVMHIVWMTLLKRCTG